MKPAAIVFDAYGTLFDIHAPTARAAAPLGEKAESLSNMWRMKQLQYTWLRSLMPAYADFWQVTGDALDYSLAAHGIDDPALREQLMALYRTVDAYDDAAPMLNDLKAAGIPASILSNGEPSMLDDAVRANGFSLLLDSVLSVDAEKIFKPAPNIYEMAAARYGGVRRDVVFVSANAWDAAGGANFGFTVVWINRFGQPMERIPGTPAAEITTLADLAATVAGL